MHVVKKACAGLFCSWTRYKERIHFLGSVWNYSHVSYCSSVVFLNLVTWYVWVLQWRAECLCDTGGASIPRKTWHLQRFPGWGLSTFLYLRPQGRTHKDDCASTALPQDAGGGEVGFHPSSLLAKLRRSTLPLDSRQLCFPGLPEGTTSTKGSG